MGTVVSRDGPESRTRGSGAAPHPGRGKSGRADEAPHEGRRRAGCVHPPDADTAQLAEAHRRATPKLVLDGEKTPAWMRHGRRALADLLPRSSYRTLPGPTHIVTAEVLAPALIDFPGAA